MTINNSTFVSPESNDGNGILPVWICAAIAALDAVILIGNCTSFSLLLRFIWVSPMKDRTPSHDFFLCISMVSLLASMIGKWIQVFKLLHITPDKNPVRHDIRDSIVLFT